MGLLDSSSLEETKVETQRKVTVAKDMTVKDYTEEFYKLVIRSGHSEEDMEKIA